MKDVKEDDVLLLTEGHCFRDQALSICRPAHKARRQSLRATSLETLINLVASGQGVTLVPALAMRGGWSPEMGLMSHELTDKGAERQIYLTYRKRFPQSGGRASSGNAYPRRLAGERKNLLNLYFQIML